MARRSSRRRKSMFKQLALIQVDDLASAGDPKLIAAMYKQQDSLTRAWIEKVRISFILDDIAGGGVNVIPFGYLWYVTTDNSAVPDTQNLIASTATGNSGGGTVTIDVKRSITDNSFDSNSGFNALALWVEATDATVTADVDLKVSIEVFGRWHKVATA